MGRWTEICLTGRQQETVRFLTAYRVPKMTIKTAGPATSYFHQWHHICRNGQPIPDPRQQLLQDLSNHIKMHSNSQTGMVIMMDANESLQTRSSQLSKWSNDNSLIDIHLSLHDHPSEISTYLRGHHRLDYIFVTSNLALYVMKSGILPYHFLTNTDHCCLNLDIDLQRFLRCQLPTVSSMSTRKLNSTNPRGFTPVSYTHLTLPTIA